MAPVRVCHSVEWENPETTVHRLTLQFSIAQCLLRALKIRQHLTEINCFPGFCWMNKKFKLASFGAGSVFLAIVLVICFFGYELLKKPVSHDNTEITFDVNPG